MPILFWLPIIILSGLCELVADDTRRLAASMSAAGERKSDASVAS